MQVFVPIPHWFATYTPHHIPIKLADGAIVYSAGVGSVWFNPIIKGEKASSIKFTRVLHVPDLANNLFSVLFLTRHCGYTITIDKDTVYFNEGGQTRLAATINDNNAAFLDGSTQVNLECASLVSTLPVDYSLWHRRLCHHNYANVKRMIEERLVTGIKLNSFATPDPICEPCLAGKLHANPFPLSSSHASRPLELVHSDVHGPISVQTHSGFRYWVLFIDDYTRLWAVYLMRFKSQTFACFKQFKAYAENHFRAKLGTLREDKGGEYMSKEFEEFCILHGIQRQHTVRNRLQQNGVAERANRVLSEGITTWGRGPSQAWHVRVLAQERMMSSYTI